MALGNCCNPVDSHGRELVDHGTTAFPIACYHDDWSKDSLPWHWHEEWELAVITEGSAVVVIGNEKVTLHAGEGFFANSGVLHSCWNAGTGACRFHSLVFHPRLVGGSLDSVFHQRYVRPLLDHPALESLFLFPSIPWQKTVLDAMEAAWAQCVLEPEGYEFRVRAELSQLIFLLWQHMPSAKFQPDTHSLRDAERIKAMLTFIQEHYGQELSTKAIAASAMISESECLRCFRNTIGTTPIQYLKQYRIQQAATLLTTTGNRISDIASECGFQDMSYFTKSFRESKGCVPTEYRKKEANP